MYCPNCGTELADGSKYCTECGEKVTVFAGGEAPKRAKKKKKRIWLWIIIAVVIVLALIFAFAPVDDEYDYYYDGYPSQQGWQSAGGQLGSGEIVTVSAAAEALPSYVIREPQVKLKGDGTDKVTVMVYMNGSNLESEDGEGCRDLAEMIAAGSSDNVNIVLETVGTKKWHNYGIANDRSQIYKVDGNGLTLLKDDLGQLNTCDPKTLSSFIAWSAVNYPADRYVLLFWDHGAGPVYGYGYDEYKGDSEYMSMDEIQSALKTAGVYFDFIGMDCCIMSCMEVCLAMYDYCDYMVLSEDFESGMGWSYTGWLKALRANSSISTPELGKIIVDDMVKANANDRNEGDNAILSVINEGMMKVLYTAWKDFAYANENTLLGNNYSRRVKRTGRARGFFSDWQMDSGEEDYSLQDYYITDIMAVASTVDSAEADALSAAMSSTITYMSVYGSNKSMTGLSVTLPYGDSEFYSELKTVFEKSGIDSDYINWLQKFTEAKGSNSFYDYNDWDNSWDGWSDYEDDYDWHDWGHHDDESFWYDSAGFGWDDWEYEGSYNEWYGGHHGEYDRYDDDWYGSGERYEDDWYYSDTPILDFIFGY